MEVMPKMTMVFDQMEFQSLVESMIVAYESGELSVQGQAFAEQLLTALNVELVGDDEEEEEGEETAPVDVVKH